MYVLGVGGSVFYKGRWGSVKFFYILKFFLIKKKVFYFYLLIKVYKNMLFVLSVVVLNKRFLCVEIFWKEN